MLPSPERAALREELLDEEHRKHASMDIELDALVRRIRTIFLTLSPQEGPDSGDAGSRRSPPQPGLGQQLDALEADLQSLRGQRERWLYTQREVMRLLGSETPETIVHDLRNVLNNLSMLKGIVERRLPGGSSRPSGRNT